MSTCTAFFIACDDVLPSFLAALHPIACLPRAVSHLYHEADTAGTRKRPVREKKGKIEEDEAVDDDMDDGNEMICTWLQCDRCGKWRIVPDTLARDDETQRWYCENNVDRRALYPQRSAW